MNRQKNSSLKYCRKCTVLLTEDNWLVYMKKRFNYICTPCFRAHDKTYHKSDPEYNNKQRNRTRQRRSAVIFAYGNKCISCDEDQYEKLTIDQVSGDSFQGKKITTNIIDYLYNNVVAQDGYQVLCWNCSRSKNVNYKDQYALRDKKIVIEAYGNQCEECKEDKIERLVIDRSVNCESGIKMYRWLIKNKFPKNLGLQVLCHNCNCSKQAALKLAKEEPED